MAAVEGAGFRTTKDKSGNTVQTNGKSTSSAYTSNGGGSTKAGSTTSATVLTNGKSTSSPYTSNGGGNVVANSGKGLGTGVSITTTNVPTKSQTNVDPYTTYGDKTSSSSSSGGSSSPSTSNVTQNVTVGDENQNWLEDYYNALMERYNSVVSKQEEAEALALKQQQADIDSRFNRLSKRLLKNSAQKGWDAPVTNLWNIQAEADDSKNDLAIEKAKNDATNASNNWSNFNSILTSLANSSASDSFKKKYFSSL